MDIPLFDGNYTQHSIVDIMSNIGLNHYTFLGKFLDVGCGKNALLVNFLRCRGIFADGVDDELVVEEPYLMKTDACSIQRPDDYYDFAASHITHFKDGMYYFRKNVTKLVGEKRFNAVYAESRAIMLGTIYEVARKLKHGAKFVIYPDPGYLMEEAKFEILEKGLRIGSECIDSELSATFRGFIDECCARAVLTKI